MKNKEISFNPKHKLFLVCSHIPVFQNDKGKRLFLVGKEQTEIDQDFHDRLEAIRFIRPEV